MQEEFSAVKLLEISGDWDAAEKAYGELTRLSGGLSIQSRRRRAVCLMHLQRWEEMRDEIDAVFQSGATILDADVSRRLVALSFEQNAEEAFRIIDEHSVRWLRDQPRDQCSGGHILLTAAAPKTGSTSLATALAAASGAKKTGFLCYQEYSVSRGFPSLAALHHLRGASIVDHCHLAPDPSLMEELRTMPWVRIAVHLRHPADTILSVVDMVLRRRAPIMLIATPRLIGATQNVVMDWALTRYLPELLQWMQDWLDYVDAGHPSILGLSTMGQMKSMGQDGLAQYLLQNAGFPFLCGVQTDPKRAGNRMGGTARVNFTPEQGAYVQNAIPASMVKRFNWA